MKRSLQNTLYHLLPVAFWLLALGGMAVPVIWHYTVPDSRIAMDDYYWGFMVAAVCLLCIGIIGRIQRHTSSIEECFLVGLLLGTAGWWLPSVILLVLPVWGYLQYQNLFSFRSFLASLFGLAVVAVWVAVLYHLSLISIPESFWANGWAWIPTGAALAAWLASVIARRALYVR